LINKIKIFTLSNYLMNSHNQDLFVSNVTNSNDEDTCIKDLSELSHRELEFDVISKTQWFKNIQYYPINMAEMTHFILQMDILNVLGKSTYDLEKIPNLTPKRLDALFIYLKIINLGCVNFCQEVCKNMFIPKFNKIFKKDVLTDIYAINDRTVQAFMDEFYVEMGQYFLRLLTTYQKIINTEENNGLSIITKRMIRYVKNLLNSSHFQEIFDSFQIYIDNDFYRDNYETFEKMTKNIISYTITRGNEFLNTVNEIYNKFIDNSVSDEELMTFLGDKYSLADIINIESDAIKEFVYLLTQNLSSKEIDSKTITMMKDYDNFLYNVERKRNNNKYATWVKDDDVEEILANDSFWHDTGIGIPYNTNFNGKYNTNHYHNDNTNSNSFYQTNFTKVSSKVAALNFSIYPYHGVYNILSLFVKHELVANAEILTRLISMFMEYSKHDETVYHKHHRISLVAAYQQISGGFAMSYDELVSALKESSYLPDKCPIEFIFRIISRIFNVIIVFYDANLMVSQIDNTIHPVYTNSILIYQYEPDEYYLLHPKNESFKPVTQELIERVDLIESTEKSPITLPETLSNNTLESTNSSKNPETCADANDNQTENIPENSPKYSEDKTLGNCTNDITNMPENSVENTMENTSNNSSNTSVDNSLDNLTSNSVEKTADDPGNNFMQKLARNLVNRHKVRTIRI